jgi:twitching motility protein PilT
LAKVLIKPYLDKMHQLAASDLHLGTGAIPRLRVHGVLEPMGSNRLQFDHAVQMAREVLGPETLKTLHLKKNLDFAFDEERNGYRQRYRGNAYVQKEGLSLVLRRIPINVPTLEQLNLPSHLGDFIRYHQGMLLITGPSGCGKTSTAAALLNMINDRRTDHIITLEDPVEYVFKNNKALINQRQIGRDVDSYPTALKGALRQDPDVILVGELRDLETTRLAVTAAETGHLVIGTLHTQSAAKTIYRLIDQFPPEQQAQIRTMMSETLRAVITQQLIARADGRGRIPAVEVLVNTDSVANMIRDGKTYQLTNAIQTGRSQGMIAMDVYIQELIDAGRVTKEEAISRGLLGPAKE